MIGLNLGQTSTGIYIGAKYVYALQLKATLLGPQLVAFGQRQIKEATQAETPEQRNQAKVEALKQVLQENNISAHQVITAISGQDALIRYFQIPKIPKAEWVTAIKFEAKRYIPFKIDELMWDFQLSPSGRKDNRLDVTFVAVKKEIAQAHLDLLKQAGLEVLALEPAPFSLVRFFSLSGQLPKDRPAAIVDVDYGTADINILKKRSCYLTRDVNLPHGEKEFFENLVNEIKMSLDYYEKLFLTEQIGKILLCGGIELKDWPVALSRELKIPVEIANLAKVLKIKAAKLPLSMVTGCGLALRGQYRSKSVNLCQAREVKPRVMEKAKELGFEFTPQVRKATLTAALVSGLTLILLYLFMFSQAAKTQKQLKDVISLRPQISLKGETLYLAEAMSEELEQKRQNLQNRLSIMSSVVEKRVLLSDKLKTIAEAIPKEMWLTELSFSEQLVENKIARSLVLKGTVSNDDPAQQIALITGFVSRLKEDKEFLQGFAEIRLDAMSTGNLPEIPAKNFQISCVEK